jgi:hypothetical protein
VLVALKKQMENTSSAVPQICIIYYTEREYNMPAKSTQKEFIQKARKIHGHLYRYNEAKYANNHTLLTYSHS